MKIKSISFEGYKSFSEKQTIKLKPITILIGKNSSGKSSIAKLLTLIENSLSGEIEEPLLLKNNGVELGAEFKDLVYGRFPSEPVKYSIVFEDDSCLEVSILEPNSKLHLKIDKWSFANNEVNYSLKSSRDDSVENKNKYKDENGAQYYCEFKGFLPIKKFELIANETNQTTLINFSEIDFKINVDYIGPFRVLPDRQFHLTGQIGFQKTGVKGENAYSMLGVSKLLETDLCLKVGNWYKHNFDDWKLVVDGERPYTQIFLCKNDVKVNIVDVGQGMNQALPLVVRANVTDKNGSIIVLEQPELHLHPAAHGNLVELFAKSAIENNQTYVIETHSENILLRLRKLVVENNDFHFTNNDIIIYSIEDSSGKGQHLREITIDDRGVLSDWPEGVFEEGLIEILKMQNALEKKN